MASPENGAPEGGMDLNAGREVECVRVVEWVTDIHRDLETDLISNGHANTPASAGVFLLLSIWQYYLDIPMTDNIITV